MSDKPYILDFKEEDNPIPVKDIVLKYIRFWPWFLVSCAIFVVLGHYYSQYAPKTYATEAKIKILDDDKEQKIIPKDNVSANPNLQLNLENHIEVIKSYRLLSEVVRELQLDIAYAQTTNFVYADTWAVPFIIEKGVPEEQLEEPLEYEIVLGSIGFNITAANGAIFTVPYGQQNTPNNDLPFVIYLGDIEHVGNYKDITYKVKLMQERRAAMMLMEELQINTSEKQSDVLTLALKSESRARNEAILDAIVNKFDNDNVADKQLVARSTLELIDQRFKDLSKELDSIELNKEDYKQLQDLSYIEADAGVSLQRKSSSEQEVLRLETQLSLLEILKRSLTSEDDNNLLAADIGLANTALNTMVGNYNEMARERQKLMLSVGKDHPQLKNLSERLAFAKQNILKTVRVFEAQTRSSLRKNTEEKNKAGSTFAQLPEKERMLRSMERQQNIKENLYLLLLRKREEAAIDYAATSSSVKVIDYSVSGIKPLWPKKTLVYPISLLLGFMLPFGVLFLRSTLDTKVHDRTEIEKLNPDIPTLIEIPYFDSGKVMDNFNDGSALAESFRILCTNTDHITPKNGEGAKVIYVTSAIKEEGKTMMALNLSLAYASMGKRVLLVGADLRNPQIHSYMDLDKSGPGLSDYLKNTWFGFHDGVQRGVKQSPNHEVYLSGAIPASAPVLLSNPRFGEFIQDAKKEYDYVVVDTAPTMLVTDTLLISNHADATLFVLRSGVTDKNLLQFSKELHRNKKLTNMAYVVNAVGKVKDRKYNYGYAYGYNA